MSATEKLKIFIFDIKLLLSGIWATYVKKDYELDGLSFVIPQEMTDFKFRGRFVRGSYEKEERRHLKKYIDADATVLELGACLGVVSCLTNVLLTDPRKHVVVEANPLLISWIERNRELNKCK